MRVSAKEWVPYAEIIAAFGVVISLLFVGYELNSNNAIQQATNDNLLYEMQDSLFESRRYMNMWEMAYERYHEGLLAEVQWQSWNRAFEYDLVHLPTGMPRQQWESGRITYGKSFAAHVDELYRQIDLGS
jgi:hypothetical protein